jgi:hypothetical protein
MLSLIADRLIKNPKLKDTLIRISFFTFQGVLGSVLVNDFIRILFGEFKEKQQVEYGLASAIALAPYVSNSLILMGNKENNLFVGLGMAIGITLANTSEKKNGKVGM